MVIDVLTGGGNGFGVAITADRAGVNRCAVSTTGGIGHYYIVAMTQCLDLVGNVTVTADGTGVGGITTIDTVGRGDDTLIDVSGFAHGTASITIDVTGIVIAVTQRRGLIGYVAVTADGTSVGGIAAVDAIGSGHRSLVGVGDFAHGTTSVTIDVTSVVITVTQCGSLIGYVTVATGGTGVGGITTVDAIGSGHYNLIIVTQSYGFIGHITITTDRAGVSSIATVLAIRGSYITGVVVSDLTDSAADVTVSITGVVIAVTQRRRFIGYVAVTADGASVGSIAAVGAIGSGHHSLVGMSNFAHGTTNVTVNVAVTVVGVRCSILQIAADVAIGIAKAIEGVQMNLLAITEIGGIQQVIFGAADDAIILHHFLGGTHVAEQVDAEHFTAEIL